MVFPGSAFFFYFVGDPLLRLAFFVVLLVNGNLSILHAWVTISLFCKSRRLIFDDDLEAA